jgi:hypothetical protein
MKQNPKLRGVVLERAEVANAAAAHRGPSRAN